LNVQALVDEARAAGIRFALADGQVRLAASAPPPELLARLRERRIMAQAFGVVHVLVSSEATENRLTQQTDKRMAAILAGAGVGQDIARQRRQSEHVIEFAIGQQSGIGGHHRAAKLEHDAAVKIEPESATIRFTRRVRHDRSLNARISY
jgi:hypothetical protein